MVVWRCPGRLPDGGPCDWRLNAFRQKPTPEDWPQLARHAVPHWVAEHDPTALPVELQRAHLLANSVEPDVVRVRALLGSEGYCLALSDVLSVRTPDGRMHDPAAVEYLAREGGIVDVAAQHGALDMVLETLCAALPEPVAPGLAAGCTGATVLVHRDYCPEHDVPADSKLMLKVGLDVETLRTAPRTSMVAAVGADVAALPAPEGGVTASLRALATYLAEAIDALGATANPATAARLAQELRTVLADLAKRSRDADDEATSWAASLGTPEREDP